MTDTEIIIRKGKKEDLPQALELIKELAVYENASGEVEVNLAEMQEWGFGTDKQFDFFVAVESNKIKGIALYYYKYSTWKGKCIFLEDIIVTETVRGRGIGKKLFDAVLEQAKNEKVKRLEWQVLNWNEPAIRFYKKYNANFDEEWINCRIIPN